LLRSVETPESLPGSRIVLTPQTRTDWTAGQMEVVAIGAPAACQDVDCERPHAAGSHPLDAQRGDWVLVRHRALLETDQEGLFACHQDDIYAIL